MVDLNGQPGADRRQKEDGMTLSAVQWDFANQEAEDNYQRALRRYPAQVVVDLAK